MFESAIEFIPTYAAMELALRVAVKRSRIKELNKIMRQEQ
jgi:hypothetical protein